MYIALCCIGHFITSLELAVFDKGNTFRITFTANGRNDHGTIFTLCLPLAVLVSQ